MSDDLLERATAALRETTETPADELERARQRARLLAGARRRAGLRPQTVWQWAAVILAGFFVSTAMAHVIRVQGPRILEALRPHAAVSAPKPKAKPARRPQPVKPPEPAVVAEPAQPEPPAAPVPAPTIAPAAPSDAGVPLPQPKRPAPSVRPKPSAASVVRTPPPSTESPELTLFREAQALHLQRDARAIEAWDAYLRAAENGPLVPEAQYNRALGLVRAGRYAEAKSALSSFAQGAFGGYRQREAQALLERLASQ